MAMKVRTRFAPSPTGELHLGNVRIAALNWLFARHSDGKFILRIEDTDVDRNVAGAEQEIIESLRRLGLEWDEGPDAGGELGPYRQSERSQIYSKLAEHLLAEGLAFRCYCTPADLEAKKEAALAREETPRYDGTCRDLSPDQAARLESQGGGLRPSIRFRVPRSRVIIHDMARGDIAFDAGEFGDFVIRKSNGSPTYNFAVVVDDQAMAVSHVIRGAGHLANTPRQVMIYQALNAEPPAFLHVPHVLAPDGAPLSKRSGARSLREYLDDGYDSDALINYLSLLSWSSVSGEEILPPERLIEEIDLERIGTSDARLDPDKLEWLSGEYIRRMAPDELAERLAPFVDAGAYPGLDEQLTHVASAVQERIATFKRVNDFLPLFRPPDPMEWSADARRALKGPGIPGLFAALRARLAGLADWNAGGRGGGGGGGGAVMDQVRAAGRALGLKGRDLFMPVRAGMSGATAGPELADIFAIQGQEISLRVIDQLLAELEREAGAGTGAQG